MLAIASLAAFVCAESRAAEPVLPPRLFANPVFRVTSAIGLVIGFALFGSLTYLPLFQQTVRGLSPTEAGLQLIPLMVGLLAASITSGRVITSTGRYKAFPIAGTAVAAIGLLLLSRLEPDTGTLEAGAYMLVLGVGLGLVMQVLVLAVQNAVPYSQLGVATSSATLFRSIGGSLGTSILGAIFANRLATELATSLPPGADTGALAAGRTDPSALADLPPDVHAGYLAAFTDSLHTVFLIAAAVVAVAFLLAWLLPERPLRRTIETSEGIGEAFAAPTIGDSLRELSRQLAVAAGRERSRDFIARMADPRRGRPRPARLLDARPRRRRHDPRSRRARGAGERGWPQLAASVAELRAAGFVTDDTGPATLTPAGIEALGRLRVAWREELRSLVADWEPESDPELSPLIARLAEELADDPEPARA